jgi:hypothetical protein
MQKMWLVQKFTQALSVLRPTRKHGTIRRFRPELTPLEPRMVLDTMRWTGAVDSNVFVPGNWLENAVPGWTDTAVIREVGPDPFPHQPEVPAGQAWTVGTVNCTGGGFESRLTVNGLLKVGDALVIDSFDFYLTGSGEVSLVDGSSSQWRHGIIDVRTIYVAGSSELAFGRSLLFHGGPDTLGSERLVIGQAHDGSLSPGWVYFVDTLANINLGPATVIEVKQDGWLMFENDVASNGGFNRGTSANHILNEGHVTRTLFGTVKVGMDLQNIASTAIFEIKEEGSFWFDDVIDGNPSFYQEAGRFIFGRGAQIEVRDRLMVTGGDWDVLGEQVEPPPAPDPTITITMSTVIGNVIVTGGNMTFLTLAQNHYHQLWIWGNFTFGGTARLSLNVDGLRPGSCDSIQCLGNVQLNGGTLAVTTIRANPPGGTTYTLIAHQGTIAGNFTTFHWLGMCNNYEVILTGYSIRKPQQDPPPPPPPPEEEG